MFTERVLTKLLWCGAYQVRQLKLPGLCIAVAAQLHDAQAQAAKALRPVLVALLDKSPVTGQGWSKRGSSESG